MQAAPEIPVKRLLHYTLIAKLGQGGMGVVYKAHDAHLDRFVAIKVLPPEKMASAVEKARFVQEAKAASALNHSNIVVVHDIASDSGADFIVMEYVAGKTLDQVIPRSGMRLGEALKIAIQVADALSRAHSAGIVHRDLKPTNVMVDEDGHVKILDFGLAKLTERSTSDENSTTTLAIKTAEGTVVGTAPYMSPEQAQGKPVDARSDIFSFGCLLYEIASGRRAFHGETTVAILSAILQNEPKPVEGLPTELEKVIGRCLRKDPARRIQHMDDVRLALEDLKEDSDSGKLGLPSPPPRRRTTTFLACAGICTVVVVAAGAWFLRGSRAAEQAASAPELLTSYPGDEIQPSLSPDANQVAFAWNGEHQDNADIYVKIVGSEKPLRLTDDPADDVSPAWSPDGRFIAFFRNQRTPGSSSGVYIVPAIGGPEKLVAESEGRFGTSSETHFIAVVPHPLVAWVGGRNTLLLCTRPAAGRPVAISSISIDTGERRQLTSPPVGVIGDGAPALAANGRTLLFSRALNMSSAELYRIPLTTDLRPAGREEVLTSIKQWSATPVWITGSPDFLFSTGGKFDGPFRLWRKAAEFRSEAREATAYGEAGWPAYSPARRRLVFSRSSADSNIWRAPLLGPAHAGAPAEFIASTREENVPQYSPDGSKLAFTSNRTGQHEVWVSASDGSNAVQLTALHAGMTGSPHWSPDGKQIVFDSTSDGRFQIYRINGAGGSPHRVTSDPSDNAVASYSHDGRFIYFTSNRSGRWEIWKMPAEGGDAIQVTRGGGRNALESPDGSSIYYERGLPRGLWKCPVHGGTEAEIVPSIGFINFALTGDGIYFIPDSVEGATVQLLPYSASVPKLVLSTSRRVTTGLAISPDGKFLLYSQVDHRGSDLMLVENFR